MKEKGNTPNWVSMESVPDFYAVSRLTNCTFPVQGCTVFSAGFFLKETLMAKGLLSPSALLHFEETKTGLPSGMSTGFCSLNYSANVVEQCIENPLLGQHIFL